MIIAVGRLEEQKNFVNLIIGFSKLNAILKGYKLIYSWRGISAKTSK